MGAVVSAIKKVVKKGFEVILKAFEKVIAYAIRNAGRICDVIFSQRQFEFSSGQNQAQTQEMIAEQNRTRLAHRRLMTCKCCNINLFDFAFDCGHFACETCNASLCAFRCFECHEIIRERIHLEYNRSMFQ